MCCETCPSVWHLRCVGLRAVPKGEWHCPNCRAAEKAKKNKKKRKRRGGDDDEDDEEDYDDKCSTCNEGGNLICCDGPGCKRAYHLACAGLQKVGASVACLL